MYPRRFLPLLAVAAIAAWRKPSLHEPRGGIPSTTAPSQTAAATMPGARPSAEPTVPGHVPTPGATTAAAPPVACTTMAVAAISTAPPGVGYSEPVLKYIFLDRYGQDRFFWCNPDKYPVPRGDELERAVQAFPAIRRT